MRSGAGAGPAELSGEMRTTIHDLRNLFSVVDSAQRILLRGADITKLGIVARALELVARDGIALTTRLLAHSEREHQPECDPNQALRDLEAMLVPLGGPRTLIRVEASSHAARLRIGALDFQAIALEMVSNALAAGARRVVLRGKVARDKYWLLAVDDGRGCDMDGALAAFADRDATGAAHGSGLNRIGRAVRDAGGIAKMRSESGRGCAVGLVFAMLEETGPADPPEDQTAS